MLSCVGTENDDLASVSHKQFVRLYSQQARSITQQQMFEQTTQTNETEDDTYFFDEDTFDSTYGIINHHDVENEIMSDRDAGA